jgi:hypothetical protein
MRRDFAARSDVQPSPNLEKASARLNIASRGKRSSRNVYKSPESGIYYDRLGFVNFGCVKAPGFDDRKRIYIVNIDPFAIAEPRELSR